MASAEYRKKGGELMSRGRMSSWEKKKKKKKKKRKIKNSIHMSPGRCGIYRRGEGHCKWSGNEKGLGKSFKQLLAVGRNYTRQAICAKPIGNRRSDSDPTFSDVGVSYP